MTPRAHRHEDRNGDPLDGLVNLFDIGIVLAVAFLLAALSSLHLTTALTKSGLTNPSADQVRIDPSAKVSTLPSPGARAIGRGTQVGTVYQLEDGRLVYVTKPSATLSPSDSAPSPTSVPTQTPSSTAP